MAGVAPRGRGRRTINEINMVPFIDVMLVLLIIFMVTAPLIAPSVINLPSVAKASDSPPQVIEVVIAKDETLELKVKEKSSRMSIAEIVEQAKQAQATQPPGKSAVVISADRAVKYEAVVNVMNELQKAGIQRVGLSVQLAK